MKILVVLILFTVAFSRKLIPLSSEMEKKLKEKGYEPDETWNEVIYDDELQSGLPEEFDVREKWPKCIHPMHDEGNKCLASWAIVASSVFSDHYCIDSNSTHNEIYSPQYLINCAKDEKGCKNKSNPRRLFDFIHNTGLPTDHCVPFTSGQTGKEDACPTHCANNTELKLKKCNRTIFAASIDNIKYELYHHGPMYCQFDRYEDFDDYKSGIYYKVSEKKIEDNHVAKLIGWGVENTLHYWTLSNVWSDKWGENGNFRIMQGQVDVCKIAGYCTPDLKP